MLKIYLKKAPTLIVIGVTGFVAGPILLGGSDPGPPKIATQSPVTANRSTSVGPISMRDPFQVERPPSLTPTPTPTQAPASTPNHPGSPGSASPAGLAASKSEPRKANLPAMAADEDQILAGMRLVGTFIDDREKLAVIDHKVYARGDQLRGADGSLLPYVITDIRTDRALLRRGRRDFVIAFSNVPRPAGPVAVAPSKAEPTQGLAKSETKVGANPAARAMGPGAKGQPRADPGDPREMLLRMLSGLGSLPASGGSGTGGGLNPTAAGIAITPSTISAGLDALMGKNDNIGRGGDESPLANPAGGTTP